MPRNTNTQLTEAENYDVENMRFSDPLTGNIPDSKLTYQRIMISTVNPDGSEGDLIMRTEPKIFSPGIREQLSLESGKLTGHVMPLCLWNRDGPSPKERAFTDTIVRIVKKCKEYILINREKIGKYELKEAHLDKFDNVLSWQKEKGKVVEGTGPSMWVKLITRKGQIVSMFFDSNKKPKNPLDLLNQYCLVDAAIKFESIFIGSNISLQVKLYECIHEPIDQGMKSLLTVRPEANPRVLLSHSAKKPDDDDDDDEGSLGGGSDDEVSSPPKATPKKPPVKRVVRKVAAK